MINTHTGNLWLALRGTPPRQASKTESAVFLVGELHGPILGPRFPSAQPRNNICEGHCDWLLTPLLAREGWKKHRSKKAESWTFYS